MELAFAESGTLSIGVVFWLLWIIWVIFGGVAFARDRANYVYAGGNLLLIVLFFLMGWQLWGFPIGKE